MSTKFILTEVIIFDILYKSITMRMEHKYTIAHPVRTARVLAVAALALGSFVLSAQSILHVRLVLPVHAAEKAVLVSRPKNTVMKVKIGDALQPTQFTANGKFVVEDSGGTILGQYPAEKIITINYRDGQYILNPGKKKNRQYSELPLQVTPLNKKKLVEVVNFEQRPAWNPDINDNLFYHTVRVVYTDIDEKAVLVNRVGIERYVEGIAETGSEQQTAYVKALLTAARTYAFYNINHCTKFSNDEYCLDTTENSQLYRGANYTARAPWVAQARRKTKKQIVTYNGEGIVAPYFSQSDGRTRAWKDVWYGDQPWAQAVDDPCCTADERLGHGVGLSGKGARYFAQEGWSWKRILRYYYTDTTIKKGY